MSETNIVGTVTADDEQLAREAQFEVVQLPPRRVGRPTKLTEARFKRILEHIRNGITIVGSVTAEGITYQAWRHHLQRKPDWQKLVDDADAIREEIWRAEALQTVLA